MIAKNMIWLVIFVLIILSIYMPKAINREKNKDRSSIDLRIAEYKIKEYIADFILFSKLRETTKDEYLTKHYE